jgi:hypothetical protein
VRANAGDLRPRPDHRLVNHENQAGEQLVTRRRQHTRYDGPYRRFCAMFGVSALRINPSATQRARRAHHPLRVGRSNGGEVVCAARG